MTKRAVLLGMIGTLLMGAYGQYANKYVPGSWGFVRGYMPVTAYGLLAVFALAINPLLGRIKPSWRLCSKEMALVVSMILLGCAIADQGMMRYFPRQMIHPVILEKIFPGWQKADLLKHTPPAMLANNGEYSEEVVRNYIDQSWNPGDRVTFKMTPVYGAWAALTGREKPAGTVGWGRWVNTLFGRAIPASDVPWHAWIKPMAMWGSVIVLVMMAAIGLATVVHRQWAEKERIRYPLGELAASLIRQDEQGRTVMVRNRLFWLGLTIPLFIRIVNGIYLWTDQKTIEIPMALDLSVLNNAFPRFMETPGATDLTVLTIYPACVGLTYMLAADIGFSLWIVGFLSVAALFVMNTIGVDVSGSEMTGGVKYWYSFGSSMAMALTLFWIGRRYYWNTLKAAVTFRRNPETESAEVWGCRVCLVGIILSTVILGATGMDPIVAAAAVGSVMLIFLLVGRVNAECGLFFFGIGWTVPGAMLGIFGDNALGPTMIICLGMIRYLIQGDGEHLLPFVTNGLKMTTDAGLKPAGVALAYAGAILLTIAVAIPTSLWADYNHAAQLRRGGDSSEVFIEAERVSNSLTLAGNLDKVYSYGPMDRLAHIQPPKKFVAAAATGFVLLLACSALRLRFTWWPIHPVAVLFGLGGAGRFMFSFLLGWAIKTAVTKYGSAANYARFKPAMIGVVVGDLTGGFIFMVVSWVYYAVTGTIGKSMLLW
jgi:hypothetical protein